MKTLHKTLSSIFFMLLSFGVLAQDKAAADSLVKQGIQIGHTGKHAEAIAKFNEALKIDPNNMEAVYEIGYNLYVSGNGMDAVPYLEKVISSNPTSGSTYDLLGTIYDENKLPDKAIETYLAGIKASPDYQNLYYNLGVSYFGQKKYNDAELNAIKAIKLNPGHASSHRLYAMATYYQNKHICAILGFCNFLLIENQTDRSASVYKYLRQVMQSGVSKGDGKNVNITYNVNKGGDDDIGAADLMISLSAASSVEKNKNLSPFELFESQLASIFGTAGELSGNKKEKNFFWKYYADYFYQLSKSANMEAFTRLISQSGFQEENTKWLNDNPEKVKALENWVKTTERNF